MIIKQTYKNTYEMIIKQTYKNMLSLSTFCSFMYILKQAICELILLTKQKLVLLLLLIFDLSQITDNILPVSS